MITLALVGIVSGLITAISPCVLPVLPAILTSAVPAKPSIPVAVGTGLVSAPGKTGGSGATAATTAASNAATSPPAPDRWRPIIVVAGLVTSFAVFTLVGGSLLGALNLPQDFLRWTGIVVLVVVGVGLLIPGVGHLLERPFQSGRLPRFNQRGSGFVMGLALGLIFVPCAGPILAAITVLAATNGLSWGLVVLTLAFSVGIAIPLLAFALAGQSLVSRIKAVRERLSLFRKISGGVLIATAVLIAANVFEPLQRLVPPVLSDAQAAIEDNQAVRDEIDNLTGREDTAVTGAAYSFDDCELRAAKLQNCGPARDFVGITDWLNTPDGQPLTIDDLKGKVVLIDFWTYSCINCQRTLPFLTQWYEKYKDDGFVIVGVHTPEFAFEEVASNVEDATRRFNVNYPVALDNDYQTWREWDQRFWPAHYLIDKDGVVRQVHYGEGLYTETEHLIQQLLDAPQSDVVNADEGNHTYGRSPETYVGYARLNALANDDLVLDEAHAYTLVPRPDLNDFSLGGTWTVESERAVAGDGAVLRYHFFAADVHLVLGGEGTVTVTQLGDPDYEKVVDVSGSPTLYDLWAGEPTEDTLQLEFSPGVEAYAFTFG